MQRKRHYFEEKSWKKQSKTNFPYFVVKFWKLKKSFERGGSRIFSRGGGIFKKNSKILTTFFLGRPNWFFELSQSSVLPLFWLSFWKKNSQKSRFWALFKTFWQKKLRFFGARSPSTLVFIGAKGAFRKILGSVGQKWISEKVSKGGPLGSAGGRIPEGGVRHLPPP